jgi:hypothetical protein
MQEEFDIGKRKPSQKAYFMRNDLTTAENFFNIEKMKTLAVNHNSI